MWIDVILPDEMKGCPYLANDVAEMYGMASETAAKKFCRLGCCPICSQLLIYEAKHKKKKRDTKPPDSE